MSFLHGLVAPRVISPSSFRASATSFPALMLGAAAPFAAGSPIADRSTFYPVSQVSLAPVVANYCQHPCYRCVAAGCKWTAVVQSLVALWDLAIPLGSDLSSSLRWKTLGGCVTSIRAANGKWMVRFRYCAKAFSKPEDKAN